MGLPSLRGDLHDVTTAHTQIDLILKNTDKNSHSSCYMFLVKLKIRKRILCILDLYLVLLEHKVIILVRNLFEVTVLKDAFFVRGNN